MRGTFFFSGLDIFFCGFEAFRFVYLYGSGYRHASLGFLGLSVFSLATNSPKGDGTERRINGDA